jgi:hypothetical protein
MAPREYYSVQYPIYLFFSFVGFPKNPCEYENGVAKACVSQLHRNCCSSPTHIPLIFPIFFPIFFGTTVEPLWSNLPWFNKLSYLIFCVGPPNLAHPMVKIEVFNAFQARFGPSIYASSKTTLQNAILNWKWRRHLKSSISIAHHKNQRV